jgi:HAD superfamily phosphatase (TIGR01681 family)
VANPRTYNGCLISDFNIANLGSVLDHGDATPAVKTTVPDFGQVMPTLLNPQDPTWEKSGDFAVVWTRPEGVVHSFNDVLDYAPFDIETVLDEVDQYCDAIESAAGRTGIVLVPTWVVASYHRGLGVIDRRGGGVRAVLAKMNQRLADRFDGHANVFVLDAQRWIEMIGSSAFNPKFWYMGKIPFSAEVFKLAAVDIRAAVGAANGDARKLIVLDLDNTLWGGIVGDDGWEGLKLGGHDAIGESFADFQKALKALKNRGVLLAIASKNQESVALDAIESHPEMVLRKADFVGWRINWEDKARNIASLVEELNLGLQAVVFIDDNPAERARVAEQLPEVFVPDWPVEKMLYKQALLGLSCFETTSLTDEDLKRTQMYVSENRRKQEKSSVGSIDDWLNSLEL